MKELITDFTYGAISRKLDGRVDLPIVGKAASELYNMIVTPQGIASRMTGTKFVTEVETSAEKIRLIPMEISESIAYVLEFGNEYIRFIRDGVQLGSPFEVVTTYLEADLPLLKFAQMDKELYLVHPSYHVRILTFTSETSWAIIDAPLTALTTADNYPSVITFHEGRLVLAGTNNNPQTVWGSKVLDYNNFSIATEDSDPWQYEIGVSKYNKIMWMVSGEILTIGTTGSEVQIYGSRGITPTDIQIKQISTFGSSNIQAQLVGLSLLFVQKAGRKVREFAYTSIDGALNSPDLTVYADHITESGLTAIAYQQEPVQCLWCVRDDGYLVGLSFDRTTGLTAWHSHYIGGVIEGIAVVPAAREDAIYIVVKRTINGSSVRYIEYFTESEPEEQDDLFYVNSGVTVSNGDAVIVTGVTQADPAVITSVAHGYSTDDFIRMYNVVGMVELNNRLYKITVIDADTFSLRTEFTVNVDSTNYTPYISGGTAELVTSAMTGLNHLEGESVAVFADGALQQNQIVSSGAITLTAKANKINIGLPYMSYVKTLRLQPSLIGEKKRISNFSVRLYKTLGIKIGIDLDNLYDVGFRNAGLDLSAPELFTGDKTLPSFGNYDADNFMYLVQDEALPLNICAVSLEYSVGGRK